VGGSGRAKKKSRQEEKVGGKDPIKGMVAGVTFPNTRGKSNEGSRKRMVGNKRKKFGRRGQRGTAICRETRMDAWLGLEEQHQPNKREGG